MSLYSKVVVQPDQANAQELHWLKQHHIQVYAYLSVGESDNTQQKGLLKNKEWDSQVMDLTSPHWQEALLLAGRQERIEICRIFRPVSRHTG
ncbi:hypothetical protein P4S72_18270 [Vibrio sp. PP-XX7]